MQCEGSGKTAEVFNQRMVKQGITYVYKGGSVYCADCDTYVRLKDPHSVPVDTVPDHAPGQVRP